MSTRKEHKGGYQTTYFDGDTVETGKGERGPRVRRVPSGDSVERLVCPECNFINYENPLMVVGAVVTFGDKFLLCKRSIEPRAGFWTIPAGYMELHETPLDGAKREAVEEANAAIEIDALLAIYTIPRISQVQMIYRASLPEPHFSPGPESTDVGLFSWDEIPWQEIAFPTVHWALNHFQEVRGQSAFAPFTNPEGATGTL
ncbi:NUDIX hydrolase [Aestuariispira insulae]|uniref:ADP-ribose pyrophosphatase YjhB (NUDIX family) n=1 Tax=Aestuariispira insulae TaxID=1461337 RepID=A0A3D9HGL3_9PROT|nr:NUDIX hydrolase [Aestuariispira insulae]RED48136.1 ADP-ribose pyrophosphatase YjhB (NUDIX family) [Aestuariispira insulae]